MNQPQENTAAAEDQSSETTHLPEMNAIESSNINAIGYDGTNAFVEFKDGTHWAYESVPVSLYTEWMNAESKGAFFHAKIKGQFNSGKWVDDAWVPWHESGNDSGSEQTSDSAPSDTEDTVRSDSGEAHPMEQDAQEKAAEQGNEESQPDTAQEAPEQPTDAGGDSDPAMVVSDEPDEVKSWSWRTEYGLRVTLYSGEQYEFSDAPANLVDGLGTAGSPTKYFEAQVVPHYQAKKVD